MRPVTYIATTIPSYYFDERPSLEFEIRRTREWWNEERFDYELVTSEAVLAEVDSPGNPNARNCLDLLEDIPCVSVSADVVRIAETYMEAGIMPRGKGLDALHLALASFYRTDILLTWNCRHLANPNKFQAIRQTNTALGLFVPILTTPYELRRIPSEDA